MSYHIWSPCDTELSTWEPSMGWNRTFSEKEKLECAYLYVFLTKRKKYNSEKAEQLAQMAIFKQKYHGIQYSDIQENELVMALKPIL